MPNPSNSFVEVTLSHTNKQCLLEILPPPREKTSANLSEDIEDYGYSISFSTTLYPMLFISCLSNHSFKQAHMIMTEKRKPNRFHGKYVLYRLPSGLF
jgi:hypothetical protein